MSTTTPQIPTMSAHTSPTKSTPRRVLGDISPRTINTPSKQTTNKQAGFEDFRARSPLKQVQTHSSLLSSANDKENASTATFQAGRKRTIDDMHGADHQSVARIGSLFATRDGNMPAPKVRVLSETPQGSSIDRGSSTEPDSPIADHMGGNIGHPSQESNASFSAFVDWAECATQTTQAGEATPALSPQTEAPTHSPPTSKQPSKASLLRLRLGFAGYKVRTNQIARPVSEILSSWEVEEEAQNEDSTSNVETPKAQLSAAAAAAAAATAGIPSITFSSASSPNSPAQLHIKARLDPGAPIPKLSSATAPILLPTTYSSRTINYHVPSSPPPTISTQLPQCVSPEEVSPRKQARADYRTPAARRIHEADYEDEYDVDEEEEEMDVDVDVEKGQAENVESDDDMTIRERLVRQRESGFSMGDLTSSVVKGRAAMGLLELGGGGGRGSI